MTDKKKNNIKKGVRFILDNNRDEALNLIEKKIPQVKSRNFWYNKETTSNEELADYLTSFLSEGENLSLIVNAKFPYNEQADNYTTNRENLRQVENLKINEKSGDYETLGEKNFWVKLKDFLVTTKEESGKRTTNKINVGAIFLIISAIGGVVAVIVLTKKKKK